MFEKATRLALRFTLSGFTLTTEDLWSLPLLNSRGLCLDLVEKEMRKHAEESAEESFVKKDSSIDDAAKLRLEIVRHIITVRLGEAEEAKTLAERRAQKQTILALIEKKKLEKLDSKDIADLEAMYANL